MTESAAEGSVATATAVPAGTPEAQPATTDNGSAVQATNDPFSGLSEDTRKWVETKGYKSPEDIVKAYQSAEQKLGTTLTPPKDDAPQEEWAKFYDKLGRPEKAEGYDFKRPEGLPEDLPYSDELASTSKNWMHEAGLNPKQAQAIHDKFAGYMADQQKAVQEAQAKAVTETHADLTKDWGPQDSEGFKQKLALADRAMKKLGLTDAYKQTGILLPDGALTNPQIAKAFAEIGHAMFKEDTIGNEAVPVSDNPFKKDAQGNRNIAGISALFKTDPERAKRLAREAGEDPLNWGLR
jgi:hypothetical protein